MLNDINLNLGVDDSETRLNFHDIISNPNDLDNEDIFNNVNILSQYYDPDSFAKEFKNSKKCSLISMNICGLASKFTELLDMISFWAAICSYRH